MNALQCIIGDEIIPSRPWESLGLHPRDPLGPGGHYFFSNNALAGILILILSTKLALSRLGGRNIRRGKLVNLEAPFNGGKGEM